MLLVDDEPLVLEGLQFMVDWHSFGFRVCDQACDGEDAWERIQALEPDLVVTDLRMPVMDGLQLIAQCSQHQAKCRFVILSGHEDFDAARHAMQQGVIDYWLKPIDTDEIHRTLERIADEWRRDRAQLEMAAVSAGMDWPAQTDDALHAAEDELLQAIEANHRERIDQATDRLLQAAGLAFETSMRCRAYVTNLLLELQWKAMVENEESAASDDRLSVAFLEGEPASWLRPLAEYSRRIAERLAAERERAGAAGEAVRYIRREFRQPLKLRTVAEALHFQPAYLGQLFKKNVGMTFIDYLHRVRVEEACKLLRRTDRKIADIARSVGYTDPELFAEKFRKHMNVTPSQYRK